MATSEQIKALIRSHFEDDPERFATIALQIAAHEAQAGHPSLAHDIRKYIDRAKRRYGLLPGVSISRDLSDMLHQTKPREHLSELILHADLRNRIMRILDEYRQRQKLKQHGMTNRLSRTSGRSSDPPSLRPCAKGRRTRQTSTA